MKKWQIVSIKNILKKRNRCVANKKNMKAPYRSPPFGSIF